MTFSEGIEMENWAKKNICYFVSALFNSTADTFKIFPAANIVLNTSQHFSWSSILFSESGGTQF